MIPGVQNQKYLIPSSFGKDKNIFVNILTTNNYKNPTIVMGGRSTPIDLCGNLKLDGYSYHELFALAGLTVISFDFLGTGFSSDYDYNEEEDPIFCTYEDSYRDAMDCIKWLKNNKGIETLSLFGWSATSITALMVAERNPNIIKRIVCSSMPKYRTGSDKRPRPPSRFVLNAKNFMTRRIKDIPPERREELSPKIWEDYLYQVSVKSGIFDKAQYNGMQYNRAEIINGEKKLSDYFQWEKIVTPIFFTSGEWDSECDIDMLQSYLDQCSSKIKKLELIPDGSHFIYLEKNRHKAVKKVSEFLMESWPSG